MFKKFAIDLKPYVLSKRFEGRNHGDWLFLDWNETTYELPTKIKSKLKLAIDEGIGVAYPDGNSEILLEALEEYTGVPADFILTYNGSDSALRDCIECLLWPGRELSVVVPEYNQINTYVQMTGAIVSEIKLPNPFEFKITELLDSLKNAEILYLSNPSNPTGRYLPKSEIVKLLDTGIILLLDEAYVEFCPESCSDLVCTYRNLFVFRTFSKAFGLAGFRIGYVMSSSENIQLIRNYRNSKEINAFAQIAVIEALKNADLFQKRIAEIIGVRDNFITAVNKLNLDIHAYRSMANFVVIKSKYLTQLIEVFQENRILIRDRRGMYCMEDSARISIGTPDQMARVLLVIVDFFESHTKRNSVREL
jgi:histidinol-phosphate aminotransferase